MRRGSGALRSPAAGHRPSARIARWGRALAAACLSALMILSTSPAAAQTVRGLVIGIDAYDELRDLAGAVNDARDVAGALAVPASTISWCWRTRPRRGRA